MEVYALRPSRCAGITETVYPRNELPNGGSVETIDGRIFRMTIVKCRWKSWQDFLLIWIIEHSRFQYLAYGNKLLISRNLMTCVFSDIINHIKQLNLLSADHISGAVLRLSYSDNESLRIELLMNSLTKRKAWLVAWKMFDWTNVNQRQNCCFRSAEKSGVWVKGA